MNRLLVYGGISNTGYSSLNLAQLELRDGLPPERLATRAAFSADGIGNYLALAQSSDKRYLAVVNNLNNADRFLLFDTDEADFWLQPKRFEGGNLLYRQVAISPNCIALCSVYAPFLQLLDLATLEPKSGFVSGLNDACLAAAFSPDGSRLAVLYQGGKKLRQYDLTQAGFPYIETPATISVSDSYAATLSYSPDGNYLLASNKNYLFALFDPQDLSLLKQWTGHASYYVKGLWLGEHYYAVNTYNSGGLAVARVSTAGGYVLKELLDLKVPDGNVFKGRTYDLAYDAKASRMYLWHEPVSSGAFGIFGLSWFDPSLDTPETHPIIEVERPSNALYSSKEQNALLLLQKNLGEVRGTVRDVDNAPAARLVRAFNRQSGRLVAQTMSDALTGNYKMTLPDTQPVDVVFQSAQGELLNDLIFAKVIPDAL